MIHSFDTTVARQCGILEAVILRHIEFWIRKNIANQDHIHDGRVWTYNSVKAFGDLFPEASIGQIRRAIDKLENEGYLQVGYYNDNPTNRTKWYTLTDKYFTICQDDDLHLTISTNGIDDSDKCIYKDTDIRHTDINRDIIKGDDEFEKFWNMYNRKVARPHCERMWAKLTKAQKAEIFERLPAYIQATPDKQFRMHPATYINPANKRWQDEIINHQNNGTTTINRSSDRPTANAIASSRPNTENATVKRERDYNFSF